MQVLGLTSGLLGLESLLFGRELFLPRPSGPLFGLGCLLVGLQLRRLGPTTVLLGFASPRLLLLDRLEAAQLDEQHDDDESTEHEKDDQRSLHGDSLPSALRGDTSTSASGRLDPSPL